MDRKAKLETGADSTARGRRRVLLVEDNDDHAELVRIALQLSGPSPEIVRVEDGEQALSFLFGAEGVAPTQSECALVLLDLRLPRVDGIEVLRRLRQHEKTLALPVVVLTTSSAHGDISAAYENGAHAYVVKPNDFATFSELVRDLARFWLDWNKLPGRN